MGHAKGIEIGDFVKLVYRDQNTEKVIRGTLLKEDVHTITIRGSRDDKPITIGKSVLVKMEPVPDGRGGRP